MQEIDIEWIRRTAKKNCFDVHLRLSTKRGRHTNIVFKTVELTSTGMEVPKWPIYLVRDAMLKARAFIEKNEQRLASGLRVRLFREVELKPVKYIPAEE